MNHFLMITAVLILPLTLQGVARAEIGFGGCQKSNNGCCAESCCLICQPECKTVKVEKQCWNTECETICVPPVTLPCCKCLLSGRCSGCDTGCRESCGCCETSCPICSRNSECCRNSRLNKLFGKFCCCDAVCVTKLKAHKYDCEKTVVEWKLVCGGCGDGCKSCAESAFCPPTCCAPVGGCTPCAD